MPPRVNEVIERLDNMPWFHAVGQRISDSDVIQVRSWRESSKYFSSPNWENFAIEASNELQSVEDTLYPDRLGAVWDGMIDEVKRRLAPLVKSRVLQVINDQHVPPVLESCVRWDLLHYCKAVEFSDRVPDSFYMRIGNYYLSGHLPCGWVGDYPDGKLVIF
jgi:hypothetical protein